MKFFAQIVAAVTAEIEILVPGALSEFTLFYPIIGIVDKATITICCPACAAKESTGTTFHGFHKDDLKGFEFFYPLPSKL